MTLNSTQTQDTPNFQKQGFQSDFTVNKIKTLKPEISG